MCHGTENRDMTSPWLQVQCTSSCSDNKSVKSFKFGKINPKRSVFMQNKRHEKNADGGSAVKLAVSFVVVLV